MQTAPTPKVCGFLASEANTVLFILKLGQKNKFITLEYGEGKNEFKLGSTFFGKIYASRSDLSPDGRHFIYFARGTKSYVDANGRRNDCWNAICCPPSVTAELFLPCNDSWGGGAFFYGKNKIFISAPMYPAYDPSKIRRFDKYQISFDPKDYDNAFSNGECFFGHEWETVDKNESGLAIGAQRIHNHISITKTARYSLGEDRSGYGEFDFCHYEIKHIITGSYLFNWGEKVTWADFDNLGRLLVIKDKCLLIYENDKQITECKPTIIDLVGLANG